MFSTPHACSLDDKKLSSSEQSDNSLEFLVRKGSAKPRCQRFQSHLAEIARGYQKIIKRLIDVNDVSGRTWRNQPAAIFGT